MPKNSNFEGKLSSGELTKSGITYFSAEMRYGGYAISHFKLFWRENGMPQATRPWISLTYKAMEPELDKVNL